MVILIWLQLWNRSKILNSHGINLIWKHFRSSGNAVSIVLQNRACSSDNNFVCTYNRTFTPQTDEVIVLGATNATLAVFFDVLENVKLMRRLFINWYSIFCLKGYPDLLVLQGYLNENFRLIGFQNSLVQDVHFIKVMGKLINKISSFMIDLFIVLSDFSCDTCSHQQKLVDLIEIKWF